MIIPGCEDLGEIPERGDLVRGHSRHYGAFQGVATLVFMATFTPCVKVAITGQEISVFPEWDQIEVVRSARPG